MGSEIGYLFGMSGLCDAERCEEVGAHHAEHRDHRSDIRCKIEPACSGDLTRNFTCGGAVGVNAFRYYMNLTHRNPPFRWSL
jgi:hypothetical protein